MNMADRIKEAWKKRDTMPKAYVVAYKCASSEGFTLVTMSLPELESIVLRRAFLTKQSEKSANKIIERIKALELNRGKVISPIDGYLVLRMPDYITD